MEPVLEKLKSEFAGKVNIVRINVDEATLLAKDVGASGIEAAKTFRIYELAEYPNSFLV
jgi:thioredoxin-like negative regulator of GroEL